MEENRITVREADLFDSKDSKAVLSVLDSYARDPMGMKKSLPDGVRNSLVDEMNKFPGTLCLIAWEGDSPAGIANCFYGFSTFNAKKVINIHDLAVAPGFRGKGIGRMLLAAVEAKANETNCCKITLEVREDNRARNLYEREGFSYGDPTMYFMTKDLD